MVHLGVFTRLRAGGLSRRSLWAVADQALISGTNFVILVLLARHLDQTDFGAFTLAFTALLFVGSLQSALIVQPHMVLGAARLGKEYAAYTTTTALSQLVLAASGALLTAIGAAVVQVAAPEASPLLWALVPAIPAWQLQEFVRGVLYTEGRPRAAFADDLIRYGGQGLGVFAFAQLGWLSGPRALLVLAAASAAATLWGLWAIRPSLGRGADRRAVAENWRFGKWLAGGVLASWFSRELYWFLVAGLVSVAATGTLRAVHTVMGPVHILLRAMGPAFTPGAARAHAEGGAHALGAYITRLGGLTAPIIVAYCVLVSALAEPLLHGLYGDRYTGFGWLMAALALATILEYAGIAIDIGLRASGHSRPGFVANLWSAGIVLTVGVAAVSALGLAGAALGLVVHAAVVTVVLWRRYRRAMRGG